MGQQQQPKHECHYDRLLRETESAILIEKDDERHWIPKSQIGEYDHDPAAHCLIMPRWLALSKGLTR